MEEFDLLGNVEHCVHVLQGKGKGYWDPAKKHIATTSEIIAEAIKDLRLYQHSLINANKGYDNKKAITGVKFDDSTSND